MTDAITGIAVCGQTITGVVGNEVPHGGLELGANPATVVIVQDRSVAVPEAGMQFGVAAVPALTVSSIITPDAAGLSLGASPALFVGQQWLWTLDCEPMTLQPLTCR